MLANDLTDLFVALGDAAREQKTGVIFLLDEIQYLKAPELEALITALHKCARRTLPVTMVGAGLPQIPRLAGEAKLDNGFFRVRVDRTTELELKYLFAMARLGPLPQKVSDVAKALGSALIRKL